MSLTAITFWMLYMLGVGGALLMPLAGVLLYILIYHINPEYQWWGESVRSTGLRTSMTVVGATVIGLALRWGRFNGIGRQFPLPIVLGLALVLLACASLTWGYGVSERGMYMAEKIIKVMVFVLILIRCVQEPHQYQLVVIAWLCGVFYIGYEACGGVGVYRSGRLAQGLGGPDFAESSGLAVHLISVLPLIGAMFFMARRWWSRGLILITGALVVNTIVMTRTRNAIVGLVAMTVMAAFSLPPGYRRKGWAAIAVGALLAFELTDPRWWNRIASIADYQHDSSAIGRLHYWGAALQMAGEYPLGVGLGNFHEAVMDYVPNLQIIRAAHSTYFACLAELGYGGLVLLIAFLVVVDRCLGRAQREAARLHSDFPIYVGRWQMRFHLGWHAMALRSGLCGYLACSLFTTRLWTEDFWIMIGMACCMSNITERLRASANVPAALSQDVVTRPALGALPGY